MKVVRDGEATLAWFLPHVNGDSAKHEEAVADVGVADFAHDVDEGVGGLELLGAVGQVAVGFTLARDEAAQGGNNIVEVDEDERP